MADLTLFYGWGADDAWNMTATRLCWWASQAARQVQQRTGRTTGG